jgi:hypothetical protein
MVRHGPASRRGGDVVTVELAGWEIECCVPPPGVGDRVSWPLTFHISGEVDPDRFDRPARVSGPWRVEVRDDGATLVVDGPVVAYWSEYRHPAPAPGVVEATGVLIATLHGGSGPSDLPAVTGRVRRLWVTSQLYAPRPSDQPRYWGPVSGTLELQEVERSPRWFSSGPTSNEPARHQTGLLVELQLASSARGSRPD